MRSLRVILFIYVGPALTFLVLGSLAMQEWSKISELKRLSAKFYRNSTPVVFRDVGELPPLNDDSSSRKYASYEFEWEGERELFQCRHPIDLPADGRVRIGEDPEERPKFNAAGVPIMEPFGYRKKVIVAVPIRGEDGADAVYVGIQGHPVRKDVIKASAVSAGSLVTVLAAFLLRKRISRQSGIGGWPEGRVVGKAILGPKEKRNIQILGLIHVILGPVNLIGICYVGMIKFANASSDLPVWVLLAYGLVVGFAMSASGAGILARKRWALPWMRISGVGLLIAFPIGTALGIWTLMIHGRLTQGR